MNSKEFNPFGNRGVSFVVCSESDPAQEKYLLAVEAQKQAERESVACLIESCWIDGTPVYDEEGHLMTLEEITTRLRNGT